MVENSLEKNVNNNNIVFILFCVMIFLNFIHSVYTPIWSYDLYILEWRNLFCSEDHHIKSLKLIISHAFTVLINKHVMTCNIEKNDFVKIPIETETVFELFY